MTTKTIFRIAAIAVLGTIGLYCTLSQPESENSAQWFIDLLWSKTLGVALLYTVVRLYKRFSRTDSFFRSYNNKLNAYKNA